MKTKNDTNFISKFIKKTINQEIHLNVIFKANEIVILKY